jgi:hypothetical protein
LVTPRSASNKATGLESHRGAAVGMDGELAVGDGEAVAGLADQAFGQFGALLIGEHPSDDVAAEDIEDHIKIEVGPLDRAAEFGDIPTPELVGSGGKEFRFAVWRMNELIAPLPHRAARLEQPVHGADRAKVSTLIEQLGVDGGRGGISKAVRIQLGQHLLALSESQSAGRRRASAGDRRGETAMAVTVKAGSG